MKFLIIILFPVVASAQIIMKTGSFELNDHVDLTTGEYSNVEETSQGMELIYDCATNPIKKDLFLNYYNQSLCICPCLSSKIGSARPFYRFNEELRALNLNLTLNLENTTHFTKVDTINDNSVENGCELPNFIWNEGDPDEIILVVTTSAGKYALVILSPIYNLVDCNITSGEPSNPIYYHSTYYRLGGFYATWYVQQNGSPLFQGINISTGVTHKPYRRYLKTGFNKAGYYSLLGRKVPMERVRRKAMHHGTPSLYIVEDRGSTRLMLE